MADPASNIAGLVNLRNARIEWHFPRGNHFVEAEPLPCVLQLDTPCCRSVMLGFQTFWEGRELPAEALYFLHLFTESNRNTHAQTHRKAREDCRPTMAINCVRNISLLGLGSAFFIAFTAPPPPSLQSKTKKHHKETQN